MPRVLRQLVALTAGHGRALLVAYGGYAIRHIACLLTTGERKRDKGYEAKGTFDVGIRRNSSLNQKQASEECKERNQRTVHVVGSESTSIVSSSWQAFTYSP